MHLVIIDPERTPCWAWNGDVDKPTFQPSLWITTREPANIDNIEKLNEDIRRKRDEGIPIPYVDVSLCHSFIENGRIRFLNDCRHALAGKTAPIPDLPK